VRAVTTLGDATAGEQAPRDGEDSGGRRRRPLEHLVPLRILDAGEDLLHVLIGGILFVIAGIVLVNTVQDLVHVSPLFPKGVIVGINDVLFIVIILEILRTVTAHFTDGGFQIRPFLVIGVISAVRHILTVSASLTLEGDGNELHFQHSLWELSVNAAVVLALVIGLLLLGGIESDSNTRRGRKD
jgi:uncharacterized membrane protein (DUF373 family)